MNFLSRINFFKIAVDIISMLITMPFAFLYLSFFWAALHYNPDQSLGQDTIYMAYLVSGAVLMQLITWTDEAITSIIYLAHDKYYGEGVYRDNQAQG